MKITKARLKEIIKEEIEAISEEVYDKQPRKAYDELKNLYNDGRAAVRLPINIEQKISNLAAKVAAGEMTMADAKEKVSEMKPKGKK